MLLSLSMMLLSLSMLCESLVLPAGHNGGGIARARRKETARKVMARQKEDRAKLVQKKRRVKVVAAATRIGANGVALSLGEAQEVGGGVRARAPVSAGAAVSALSGWAKRVAGSVSGRFTF